MELDERGQPQFYLRSGLPAHATPTPLAGPVCPEALSERHAELGLGITDRTLGTWDGYRPDYGWAVDILVQEEERARDESGYGHAR